MSKSRPRQEGGPGNRWRDTVIGQAHPRRDHGERLDGPLIVVGFDTSPASQHALAYAAGAAARMSATLLVAHISTLASTAYLTSMMPMCADITTALEADQASAAHELAAEILHDVAVPWSFTVRCGDAAVELVWLAEDNSADILVVGRSSNWLHRRIGSLSARLLRRAQCPVTVVP